MRFLLPAFLSLAAYGQLSLTTGDCATGASITPGSVIDFGQVAAGALATIAFQGCNPGNTVVEVTTILIRGAGFTLMGAPTTYPDPPLNTNPLRFRVQFSSMAPASYSASLQVSNISVFLTAIVVPAPMFFVSSPCNFTGMLIDFGAVPYGKTASCTLQTTASVTLANVKGFQLTSVSATQFTLALTPACGTASFSGTLTAGIETFTLSGTGVYPLLPAPLITLDSTAIGSNEQHTLSIGLPTPYLSCPASIAGNIQMEFSPMAGLPEDDTIYFMQGNSRNLNLTLAADGMRFLIAGEPSAVFETGSTAGVLTFSVSANGVNISGDPTTAISIAPAPVSIDLATASNQILGQLNISLTGFDNTYSAGAMSFAFFDANGNVIGNPVNADFTTNFKNYFGDSTSGSTFLANVSFPVSGNRATIASVAVTLTNSAGQTQTGKLTFQ